MARGPAISLGPRLERREYQRAECRYCIYLCTVRTEVTWASQLIRRSPGGEERTQDGILPCCAVGASCAPRKGGWFAGPLCCAVAVAVAGCTKHIGSSSTTRRPICNPPNSPPRPPLPLFTTLDLQHSERSPTSSNASSPSARKAVSQSEREKRYLPIPPLVRPLTCPQLPPAKLLRPRQRNIRLLELLSVRSLAKKEKTISCLRPKSRLMLLPAPHPQKTERIQA